jgi:hypothetical protein
MVNDKVILSLSDYWSDTYDIWRETSGRSRSATNDGARTREARRRTSFDARFTRGQKPGAPTKRRSVKFEQYATELEQRVRHAVDDESLEVTPPGFKAEIFFGLHGRRVQAQHFGNSGVKFLVHSNDRIPQLLCDPDNLEAPELDRVTGEIQQFLAWDDSYEQE